MKKTLIISGAVYVILAASVIWFAVSTTPPGQKGWDEFAKVAGVGLTLVSSLMAAVVAPMLTISQQLHLGRRTALLEAYRELYASASYAYRMLAPLETGDWEISRFRAAEERLEAAEGYGFYLSNDQEQLWQNIWQSVRYIAECAELDARSQDERMGLWKKEAEGLHDLIAAFKEQAHDELARR